MVRKTGKQFVFRIIAGDLKGEKITAPDLGVTRPPLSRLRKSVFDFLQPYLQGANYLDLFSGTGSYLFEAVSRGATRAVGVEKENRLVDAINRQSEALNISDRLVCLNKDVFRAIPELAVKQQKFDIIMVAPPQYKGLIERTLQTLRKSGILKPQGLLVCQHATSETKDIILAGFSDLQRRKYGNTTFTVLGSG